VRGVPRARPPDERIVREGEREPQRTFFWPAYLTDLSDETLCRTRPPRPARQRAVHSSFMMSSSRGRSSPIVGDVERCDTVVTHTRSNFVR
jgi:hypothetical protein